MAYEHKPNTGTLFINSKTNENQPDLKGEINIDGKVIRIAAWKKTTKSGLDMYSLKVDDRPAPTQAPAAKQEFNDMPF